jgi:enoyl-CoA hydratase
MADPSAEAGIVVERRGAVLLVTIDRPQVRNALTEPSAVALAAAWDLLDSDDGLSVGVLTGSGGTFCAGRDLKAALKGDHPWVEGRGFAGTVERGPAKPLVAAVEGHALGGGFEIVLACDLVVAGASAVFGLPEVTRGRIAGAGGLNRLAQRVPFNRAVEIGLTGRRVPASELHELGLVNQVVPDGQAVTAALDLAAQIAGNAPLAVRASTEVLRAARDWPDAELFARLEPIAARIRQSEDAREGALAFSEKRAPSWRGR